MIKFVATKAIPNSFSKLNSLVSSLESVERPEIFCIPEQTVTDDTTLLMEELKSALAEINSKIERIEKRLKASRISSLNEGIKTISSFIVVGWAMWKFVQSQIKASR